MTQLDNDIVSNNSVIACPLSETMLLFSGTIVSHCLLAYAVVWLEIIMDNDILEELKIVPRVLL